jgi:flavin reductase (DIM6/NTAB) family NADH-FMN oxidoreductase RutF
MSSPEYEFQSQRIIREKAVMEKKSFPLSKAYQLLEPGPVIMVTTALGKKANIMTMSWHMMIEFVPPLVGIVMSDQNYSFNILKKTKECVINIPTVELISQVVGVGNTTGSKTDKFKKFHFTPQAASIVKAPLIKECYANLESKVVDMHMAGKYNIFILEIVKAWITPSHKRQRTMHHCGDGVFIVDGKVVKIASKKK